MIYIVILGDYNWYYWENEGNSCSTSPPGGNQVDGLPPASSNIAASVVRGERGPEQICGMGAENLRINEVPTIRFQYKLISYIRNVP